LIHFYKRSSVAAQPSVQHCSTCCLSEAAAKLLGWLGGCAGAGAAGRTFCSKDVG